MFRAMVFATLVGLGAAPAAAETAYGDAVSRLLTQDSCKTLFASFSENDPTPRQAEDKLIIFAIATGIALERVGPGDRFASTLTDTVGLFVTRCIADGDAKGVQAFGFGRD